MLLEEISLITTIQPWLTHAIGELGQAEVAGPGANPRIAEYLATVGQVGDDEIAWCSAYVNWCFTKASYLGTNKPNAKSWLDWGVSIPQPMFGCVSVFRRGTELWQGHVGFFLDQSPLGIYLLSGNVGNRVCISRQDPGTLIGHRWGY